MNITLDDKTADLLQHISHGDLGRNVRKILKAYAMEEFEKQIRWHHDHTLRLIHSKTKLKRCIEVASRLNYSKPLPEPVNRLHKDLKHDVFTQLHHRIQQDYAKAQGLSERMRQAMLHGDERLIFKIHREDDSEVLRDTQKGKQLRDQIQAWIGANAGQRRTGDRREP